MPTCWQTEMRACSRAPSWHHRCPADPRNATALSNDPGDVGSHMGSTTLTTEASWQRTLRWWQEAKGGWTMVHSESFSFVFGCVLGLLCDLSLVTYSLWATFFSNIC